MLLSRALFRESLKTVIGIASVLFILMLFVGLTQALGQAAVGKQTGALVFKLFTLEMLRATDTLLPLALFLGVLLTVSRWYRDSEMAAMMACGVGLYRLWRPVLLLGLLFSVITGALSFYISPLAAGQADLLKAEAKGTGVAVAAIRAGIFHENRSTGGVYYVEDADPSEDDPNASNLKGVFLRSIEKSKDGDRDKDRHNIVVARTGKNVLNPDTGESLLILENGRYYEGTPGTPGFRVMEFAEYTVRLANVPVYRSSRNVDALSFMELLEGDTVAHQAELHWRLARPIAVFVLVTLALVIGYNEPRRARFNNLFTGLITFFLYSNLLAVSVGMLGKEKIPMVLGLWWVHALFGGLALYALYRRANNRKVLPWP